MSTHRKNMDRLLRGLMGLCSGITCLVLLMIIGYILYRGIPSLTWNLLSTEPNNLTGNIGILPNILNTLYIIFVAMIIVLPLGVGAAIYLPEYSTSRKLNHNKRQFFLFPMCSPVQNHLLNQIFITFRIPLIGFSLIPQHSFYGHVGTRCNHPLIHTGWLT